MALERVCVFLGSHRAPAFDHAAARLGRTIAERGLTLVYGGASVGLFDVEVAHPGLTALHETASMHERKSIMYDLSDAFIAFPGGIGTLDETSEAITWSALGIHAKPVGFLRSTASGGR